MGWLARTAFDARCFEIFLTLNMSDLNKPRFTVEFSRIAALRGPSLPFGPIDEGSDTDRQKDNIYQFI